MVRKTWDEYWIDMVDATASRATCDRGRSACVFVTTDNDLLSSGYVGSPPGFAHCDEVGHLWSEDGKNCLRTIHAEQNAIIRAARNGVVLHGSTVYCTMEPCRTCAMALIGIGVIHVVAKNAYHAADWTREAFAEAGITLVTLNQETLYLAKCAGTAQQVCGLPSISLSCGVRGNNPHVCALPPRCDPDRDEWHSVHVCGICGLDFE